MSLSDIVRMEATVMGMVQGVYFRQYTLQEARRLNLVGWVANQPDGAVRVVAEGNIEALNQFLEYLHKGSPASHVRDVAVNWTAAGDEFTDFRVRYL
ncbi:MAG: acylphosphatase [Anaerolineae bacterium]|nr:acylphosphatase [Anaerolineae bacterium]RIK18759.1 MAG: acylphosphatase [Anaerolineae bacterium]